MFSKKEVNALIAKHGREKDEKEREILLEEILRLISSAATTDIRFIYAYLRA